MLLGEVDDAARLPQHPARMDIRDVLELERAGLAERAVVWDIEAASEVQSGVFVFFHLSRDEI